MANKIQQIKDVSGNNIYPITTTGAVVDGNGNNIDNLLANKVDKVNGKGLSTNDYTTIEKTNVAKIVRIESNLVQLENDVNVLNQNSELWYGIQYDTSGAISSPAVQRIGSYLMHQNLPWQSQFRACLLKDDGTVNYYLDANTKKKKADGTASILDGTDGQVMIEIPVNWYIRFDMTGGINSVKISQYPLAGFQKMSLLYFDRDIDFIYISAYEASLDRTNLKLSSVANMTTQFRGGNNNAAWDANSGDTLLGRPATSISTNNLRIYARNRAEGFEMYLYQCHLILYWAFVIEYATRNSQEDYNAQLYGGLKQGGLGAGVTTLNSTAWNTWRAYNPFIPCGYMDELGNNTGVKDFVMPTNYGTALTVSVPSYRGIENPFGHINKWCDAIKVNIQSDSDGGKSEAYMCKNPANIKVTGYDGYEYLGDLLRVSAQPKNILFGDKGLVLPIQAGGNTSTYFCDSMDTSMPGSGTSERVLFVGGSSNSGVAAGLGFTYSHHAATYAHAYYGSRLCYIPKSK